MSNLVVVYVMKEARATKHFGTNFSAPLAWQPSPGFSGRFPVVVKGEHPNIRRILGQKVHTCAWDSPRSRIRNDVFDTFLAFFGSERTHPKACPSLTLTFRFSASPRIFSLIKPTIKPWRDPETHSEGTWEISKKILAHH